MEFTAYLAAEGYLPQLVAELSRTGGVREVRERLVLASGPPRQAAWPQNIWLDPRFIPIESINQAARALKSIQRNWVLYPTGHFRRAALIQDKLPPVRNGLHEFGRPAPGAPLGSWTL